MVDRQRRCRSGDLATLGNDGKLRLWGRRDAAVKIRGYLVEPSGVEAALLETEDVVEAAVVNEHRDTEPRLVAFVVSTPARVLSISRLRGHLRERLLICMQPAVIVPLKGLPRTECGKIDRDALGQIGSRTGAACSHLVERRRPSATAPHGGTPEQDPTPHSEHGDQCVDADDSAESGQVTTEVNEQPYEDRAGQRCGHTRTRQHPWQRHPDEIGARPCGRARGGRIGAHMREHEQCPGDDDGGHRRAEDRPPPTPVRQQERQRRADDPDRHDSPRSPDEWT